MLEREANPSSSEPIAGNPLYFEHLVQINDSQNPAIEPMTRQQLWRGLVLRAEFPGVFMPWLDESTIIPSHNGSLERKLRFGDYHVHDLVSFDFEKSVHYHVMDVAQGAEFSLTMRIEEPVAGELFVRFSYSALSTDHHAQSPLGGMIKDAYRHADEDTIFRIRQFAATGVLDSEESNRAPVRFAR